MIKTLKNNVASISVKEDGAEMISFKSLVSSFEYLWNGDSNYWPFHSPVLFPIVCAAKNGTIKVDGQQYTIGNHGFARGSKFKFLEEGENHLTYLLEYSEETLKMYPYKFKLYIKYLLEDNKVIITYTIKNVDQKAIYFSLGTHPGFNCKFNESDKLEDYYIEFDKKETINRLFMNGKNELINGQSELLIQDETVLPLKEEMFEKGAMVFRDIQSKGVTLKSKTSDKSVKISYDNLPYMGIWQPKGAPFVCIEPWHGIADHDTFDGEISEKEMIIKLEEEGTYNTSYAIEIK